MRIGANVDTMPFLVRAIVYLDRNEVFPVSLLGKQ